MVNDFYECLLQANEHPVADSDCDEPVAVWLDASETRPAAERESEAGAAGRSPAVAAPLGRSTRPVPGPGFSPAPWRMDANQA